LSTGEFIIYGIKVMHAITECHNSLVSRDKKKTPPRASAVPVGPNNFCTDTRFSVDPESLPILLKNLFKIPQKSKASRIYLLQKYLAA
jgi:hypothetical protein